MLRTSAALLPLLLFAFAGAALPGAAAAQDERGEVQRYRVTLGPSLEPAYPGADRHSFTPFFDFSDGSGDEPFAYEAPDETFGFPLITAGNVYIGPTLALSGKRKESDTVAGLRPIDRALEAGVSVAVDFAGQFYGFTEVRRGLGGHDGWTGVAGVDAIWRHDDDWLISLGPRLTWGDGRHSRAYFGISSAESAVTGLAAHDPSGGIQSVGATLGGLYQIDRRWGLAAFANYGRLVGDAADSPVVRAFGSRNQIAGGVALSYTLTRRR